MFSKVMILAFMLIVWVSPVYGQEETEDSFSLFLKPGVSFPVGEDSDFFKIGGGGYLFARLPVFSLINLEAGAGYSIVPVNVAPGEEVDAANLNLISPLAGFSISYELFSRFFLEASLHGGYYFGSLNVDVEDNRGNNPLFDIGAGVAFRPHPRLSIDLGVTYRNFLGLYNDLMLTLGTAYHFQRSTKPGGMVPVKPYRELEIPSIKLDPVFPVFFKYYDDHALGAITIRNTGEIPLEDVKVSLYVNQYMDNPKLCGEIENLKGGSEAEVDLYALFNDRVLGISESTKIQANITVETTVAGKTYSNETVETLRMHDRNAMTWTDDRKAAAFVNMKDPTVMKFSKNVAGAIKGKASKAINSSLLAAMAMHEAINLYGMSYVIDPSTPYKEFYKKSADVDYLQFPKQSLEYRAGDCDDLSILYCALLEAIGIETAFITVPGHIYAAVSLDMTPLEVRRNFLRPDDFIFIEKKIWLPVEVTARAEKFLRAWEVGAQLWREYQPTDQAKLYPLREAWRIYEPVGFSGDTASIQMPDEQRLVRIFMDEVREFVQREISPRVGRLEAQIKTSGGNSKYINKLGVLYARYGLNDKAKSEFNKVLQRRVYAPTLVNMGNLFYMDHDYNEALEYYAKAYDESPESLTVLVCLARTNHAIENYGSARRYFEKLKAKSPEMASQFAYLELKGEESDRAAEIGKSRDVVIWEEE